MWWLGLLLIVGPIAARLIGREAGRRERLALVVLVGLALYGVKVLGAPSSFAMLDEFLHWATLDDIVVSGRLFTPNNVLLASPYYPGLEIASDLLVRAGFCAWEAGMLVVGVARVLTMLALFLLYERACGDSRLAGVAALVYAANPGFLFFDAQFAYESLALPLALFTMWCIQRREIATGTTLPGRAGVTDGADGWPDSPVPATRWRSPRAFVLAIGAVVVTHHVTALALSACLVVWAVVGTILGLRGRPRRTGRPGHHRGHRHGRLDAVRGVRHGRLPGAGPGRRRGPGVRAHRRRRGQPGAVPLRHGHRGAGLGAGRGLWLGGRDGHRAAHRAAHHLGALATSAAAADAGAHRAAVPGVAVRPPHRAGRGAGGPLRGVRLRRAARS